MAPKKSFSSSQKQLSGIDELREILFNRPDLFRFRAADGHFCYLWLDGRECSRWAVEFVGHPGPGKKVRGAVRLVIEDKDGMKIDRFGVVKEWKVGWVVWKTRKGK